MRNLETTQPGSQLVQHFVFIKETLANPPAMSSGRIDMENGRDFMLIQSQIIIHTVSGRHCLVIITINDKSTRRVFRHLLFIGILSFQFGRSVLTQKVIA